MHRELEIGRSSKSWALRLAACGDRRLGARATASGFAGSEHGSVAIIFALSAFLLFATVGAAIDLAQVYRAQTLVQSSLDSGALGAARIMQLGGSEQDALRAGQALLAPIRAQIGNEGQFAFSIVDNGTAVQANAAVAVRTSFLQIIGKETLSFTSVSKASYGVGSAGRTSVELTMMLDTTGSMAGRKLDDLKAAAQELVDIVVADDQSSAYSKIGIVPFSSSVKLDPTTFLATTSFHYGASRKGCVVERTWPDATTDAAPEAGGYFPPLETKSLFAPCASDSTVVPLTANKGRLHGLIQSLQAGSTTAGHLGTAWAWYMLSPNWSNVFTGESAPAPYSDITQRLSNGEPKLRKIAVLMTDGEYNTQYSSVDSTTQARQLCSAMKAAGIEVFTVGFDLGGNATAVETLRQCASGPSNFYNTTTGEELRLAFRDIALRASPLRLVN